MKNTMGCLLFLLFNVTPFYGKFVSKNQNYVLTLKFEAQANLTVNVNQFFTYKTQVD